MGERKVLNKYFPPDFDPSLVPRRKRSKLHQCEVRMMLPMSIQCDTCGEYMYRGKKFNSRKEDVLEEDYHGIRIFRFYIKCVTCSNEITFKTDPKNGDYVTEKGCSRNFEPWREKEAEEEAKMNAKIEEEQGNSMKVLENRTLDSKKEMDILDALDEIKAINQRHAKVDTQALLDLPKKKEEMKARECDLEDVQKAKDLFAQAKKKKILEEEMDAARNVNNEQVLAVDSSSSKTSVSVLLPPPTQPDVSAKTISIPKFQIKAKSKETQKIEGKKKKKVVTPQPAAVVSSLVGYGSSSSNSDSS